MRKTKIESMRTRQFLLNAALEVFYRQGVTRTTMQEIAQEAGVTRGALYWHFKNKEDLFDALFQQTFHHFFDAFQEERLKAVDDAWVYLRENLLFVFEQLASDELHRKFCVVLNLKCEYSPYNETINELANQYHHISLQHITMAMQLCYEQQRLPKNIDLNAATIYLGSTVAGLIRLWTLKSQCFDLLKMARMSLEASMAVLQSDAFVVNQSAG